MSNGDEDAADDPDDAETEELQVAPGEIAAEFEERLDDAEAALEDAETELDRDDVAEALDEIEGDLAMVEFPDPIEGEEETEEIPDYHAQLEGRLADLQGSLEAVRPPEVVAEFRRRLEAAEAVIEDAESPGAFDAAGETLDAIADDLAEADIPGPEPAAEEEARESEAEGEEADADGDEADADAEGGSEDEGEQGPDYRAELEADLERLRAELAIERYRVRTEAVEADLEDAETEDDLDEIDAALDDIAADLEDDDLPEPESDDAPDPQGEVESLLSDVRGAVEEQRNPYAEDVVDDIETARSTVTDSEWTEREGLGEVAEAVTAFLEDSNGILDTDVAAASDDLDDLAAALDDSADRVEAAGLDPDDDAETIADLLAATDDLATGLEESTTWTDLSVREQLTREGFYDRLESENRKDFPPELNVVRIAEAETDAERVLLALEKLESNFMEEACIDALRRLGAPEAFEEMHGRARKRDKPAIEVLGKIGDDRAVDTLVEFIDGDSDPGLQKVTLRALGEIGSEEATEAVAQRLVATDSEVRSHAARALGMLGDTRAVDPLADALADDPEDSVRASAAWALRSVGTERALETAADHTDDDAYLVQVEAERAAEALGRTEPVA